MAYDQTPAKSTYQTKKVNLMFQPNNRGTNVSTDEDYLNVFIELVKNKELQDEDAYITKRDGVSSYISAVSGTDIRGMHYNEDFKKLYYCVGSTMYIWNVATNVLSSTNLAFFGTTSGDVGFCDYLYDTGVVVVIATDGTTLKQITSADVITQCTDPDLPVHVPNPVFLDGYLFVLASGTSDLYNSDLNNPLLWTPGNFISAEIDADTAKGVYKLNNYLVVFGSKSIEYFWDAANATGSPLQRNDTPVKLNGLLGAVASHGNKIYFVGNNVSGEPDAFVLEDFKIEPLGDQNLVRYLGSLTTDAYTNWKGSIIGIQGHTFYLLNAGTLTYVMDLETKLWTRWAYQQSGSFLAQFAVNTKNANTYRPLFALEGSTVVHQMSPSVYQDSGITFTCSGITDNEYFDTYNQKAMYRVTVWADKPSSTASLTLQWSDDDYQSYSTARTIDLFQERPSTNQLGRFRRRAFKWSFTNNTSFRIKGLEVNINQGQW